MEDPLEENYTYEIWDELKIGEEVEITEAPLTIFIRETLHAQQTDRICREILPEQGPGTSQFIETDDGVLLWVPPQESGAQQIVIPKYS